ncbi:hypothetical protein J437_LFUL007893 [Ladona fulva]|uniref:Reverse transcriptase domain-containing protein n=1 Tax=Ladona fulva TaxID=123851 RepID=A0A8K0K8B5_LADFU|nr:hypothetical protein J437_LFUL007893 [Ladona fulva]
MLIQKLNNIEVNGTVLKVFESYMSGRKQMEETDDIHSNILIANQDDPQGSVLRSSPFLVMINYLSRNIPSQLTVPANMGLEHLVYQQFSKFLSENYLFNPLQSGFRRHHSTSTALTKVTNDRKKITILAQIYLSKAFDSIMEIIDGQIHTQLRLETLIQMPSLAAGKKARLSKSMGYLVLMEGRNSKL